MADGNGIRINLETFPGARLTQATLGARVTKASQSRLNPSAGWAALSGLRVVGQVRPASQRERLAAPATRLASRRLAAGSLEFNAILLARARSLVPLGVRARAGAAVRRASGGAFVFAPSSGRQHTIGREETGGCHSPARPVSCFSAQNSAARSSLSPLNRLVQV